MEVMSRLTSPCHFPVATKLFSLFNGLHVFRRNFPHTAYLYVIIFNVVRESLCVCTWFMAETEHVPCRQACESYSAVCRSESSASHVSLCPSSFSRQQLSKANFESPPISPKTPASAVKCKTPRQRAQKCNSSTLSHFFQKKSTTPAKESQRDSSVSHWVQRGRGEAANEAGTHSAAARLPVAVKEEPMDLEEVSVKQEDTGSHGIGSGPAPSTSPSADVKPVIKGEASLPVHTLTP